jgi:stage III sporulation protein AA
MDVPDGFEAAVSLLPETLGNAARAMPERERRLSEEIRLRTGCECSVLLPEGERAICRGKRVTREDLSAVLERATASSVHSAVGELRKGFVSAAGGVRVGVCGTYVEGENGGIRSVSSLCLRIPRQVKNAGAAAVAVLNKRPCSALVLSPPGGGKTTFLRELIRTSSDKGVRVSLADERGEVAAVWRGQAQFDVGRCTDVLSGGRKAVSAMLLLRSMNPQIIALDEITAPEDVSAVSGIANCGVKVYATAHAAGIEELHRRTLYREMLELGVFEYAVLISGTGTDRRYEVTRL